MPRLRRFYKILGLLHCDHNYNNETWSYRSGTGLASLYCSKCGKVIMVTPVDDLSSTFLKKLIEHNKDDSNETDTNV